MDSKVTVSSAVSKMKEHPALPYLPSSHDKLGVLTAAWGKGGDTVQGRVLPACPAVAGWPLAGILDTGRLGSWVALPVVGGMEHEPPLWPSWW